MSYQIWWRGKPPEIGWYAVSSKPCGETGAAFWDGEVWTVDDVELETPAAWCRLPVWDGEPADEHHGEPRRQIALPQVCQCGEVVSHPKCPKCSRHLPPPPRAMRIDPLYPGHEEGCLGAWGVGGCFCPQLRKDKAAK